MVIIEWVEWTLPGAKPMKCALTNEEGEFNEYATRLLDSLHKASASHLQATLVVHKAADSLVNGTLENEISSATWSLDPERAQLWDILARHYFHAYEADHD